MARKSTKGRATPARPTPPPDIADRALARLNGAVPALWKMGYAAGIRASIAHADRLSRSPKGAHTP